jgi:hypothetical protein
MPVYDMKRYAVKILERTNDPTIYKLLFHGVEGSREVELRRWYTATKKEVSDGSNGTKYESGFHVLPTIIEAEAYMKKFTADRVLMPLWVKLDGEVRVKEHSRANIWLADSFMIL